MNVAAAFALVVMLAVFPAHAGDAPPSFAGEVLGRFEAWDADRDERISLGEADALIDDPTVNGISEISNKHAYAVLGFDAEKDTVGVWNPHGNRFRPKGPAGLDHGYPTQRGRFTVPLADFARIFARAVFEIRPEPARAEGDGSARGAAAETLRASRRASPDTPPP